MKAFEHSRNINLKKIALASKWQVGITLFKLNSQHFQHPITALKKAWKRELRAAELEVANDSNYRVIDDLSPT